MEESLQMQSQHVLTALRNQRVCGCFVSSITSGINDWKNIPANIQIRVGDILYIRRRGKSGAISCHEDIPIAITYVPRRDLN